jgi:hypothetical protein
MAIRTVELILMTDFEELQDLENDRSLYHNKERILEQSKSLTMPCRKRKSAGIHRRAQRSEGMMMSIVRVGRLPMMTTRMS